MHFFLLHIKQTKNATCTHNHTLTIVDVTQKCFKVKQETSVQHIEKNPKNFGLVFLATSIYTARHCRDFFSLSLQCIHLPYLKQAHLPPLLFRFPVRSLSAFISSMTILLSKCQVTLRAKEEHYTAAPCHAGTHYPHSGFFFFCFLFFIFATAHLPVCKNSIEKKAVFFFPFPSSQQNVCQRPTSSLHMPK